MNQKSNFERVILSLAAVVAVAGSGWMIYNSLQFSSNFDVTSATKKDDFGVIPIEQVTDAIKNATKPTVAWTAPERSNKPVPLNKSVLLVLKDQQVYDLFLEQPQLRPPLTNSFLREYDLAYQVPNVDMQDPDADGFNNLEEFEAKTNPKDPRSHPEITNKLFVLQRIADDYKVIFKSSSTPYQVSTPNDSRRKNWFIEGTGKHFGSNDRFLVTNFEKKVVPDDKVGEKDVSELTVQDSVRENTVVFVKDVENNIADYSVEFEFRLKTVSKFTVAKEGTFRIPGFDATTYKVLDIQEDSAVIAPLAADGTTGQEILIKKG